MMFLKNFASPLWAAFIAEVSCFILGSSMEIQMESLVSYFVKALGPISVNVTHGGSLPDGMVHSVPRQNA